MVAICGNIAQLNTGYSKRILKFRKVIKWRNVHIVVKRQHLDLTVLGQKRLHLGLFTLIYRRLACMKTGEKSARCCVLNVFVL